MNKLGFCALAVLALAVPAYATTYHGSLTSADGGIDGGGVWINEPADATDWEPARMEWWVSENPDTSWHYKYVYSVWPSNGAISHLIIETTPDVFDSSSLFNVSWMGWDVNETTVEIGWHHEGPGSPGLKADTYGIKFNVPDDLDPDPDPKTVTIEFDARHRPVWGDFYAKDGRFGLETGYNAAWNAGLTFPDGEGVEYDPPGGPGDGSVEYHILVPDSSVIPEPISMIFFGTGLVGVLGYVARRKMRGRTTP